MADIYVRSTDGLDADTGATWALANATLTGAAAIDAAGDRIFVSQAHAESTAAAVTIALAGTLAQPTQVICVSDAAEPPTALATTATVTTTGPSSITITGAACIEGVSFSAGTGTSSAPSFALVANGLKQMYKDCRLILGGTNTANIIGVGSPASGTYTAVDFKDVFVKFAVAAQKVSVGQARFRWEGGGLMAGGTSPTALVACAGDGAMIALESLDLSNAAAAINIFGAGGQPVTATIRNSKLPASWVGSVGTPTSPAQRFEMHNCDDGDTNYRLWVSDYLGSIKHNTAITRTGGASDGTTPISWVMATTLGAVYPMMTLASPEIVIWNGSVGAAKTVTVEVVTDNVTLTDAECWLEVQYLGTTGFPLGSFVSDAKADVLATAANQTTSSENWTTTGLTTPVKQKLSVTCTPQEAGYIHAVVKLAKASTTVYVCPKVTVS